MTNLIDSINKTLETLPDTAQGALIEVEAEGNLEKQSAALVFEYERGIWTARASIGFEHLRNQPVDVNFKVNLKWAW